MTAGSSPGSFGPGLLPDLQAWLVRAHAGGRLPWGHEAAEPLRTGRAIGVLAIGCRDFPRGWRFDTDKAAEAIEERGFIVALLPACLMDFLARHPGRPDEWAGTPRELWHALSSVVSAGLMGQLLTPDSVGLLPAHWPMVSLPGIGLQRVVAIDGGVFHRTWSRPHG